MKYFLAMFVCIISLTSYAVERSDKDTKECTEEAAKIGAEASTYVKPIPNETTLLKNLQGENQNQKSAVAAMMLAFVASECKNENKATPLSIAIRSTRIIQAASVMYNNVTK